MRTWPPIGVYFKALDARFPKICWHRECVGDDRRLGSGGVAFPFDPARRGDRRELAVDLSDQGADRITAQAQRTRAARDRRVVE